MPEKRRYGYYSLAILHRGQIVGRLDPKMDRATQQLLIRGVYLEPGVAVDASLLDGLAETLRDLARFLGATSITVERSEPAPLATKTPSSAEVVEREGVQETRPCVCYNDERSVDRPVAAH